MQILRSCSEWNDDAGAVADFDDDDDAEEEVVDDGGGGGVGCGGFG